MKIFSIFCFWISSIAVFGQTATDYFLQGQTAANTGNYTKAIELLDKAIQLDAYDQHKYQWRGFAKYHLGKYEAAVKDLDKAIEIDSNFKEAYSIRGFSKNNLGQYEAAIKDCDKAIEIDPNYKEAYNNRGFPKYYLGQYEAAIKDFDKAIEIDPNYEYAQNNRIYVKIYLGRYEAAIKDCDKAIEINPNNEFAYTNRASAKFNLGQYKSAIKDCDKALSLAPNDSEAATTRAKAQKKLEEQRKEATRDVTEDNPNLIIVWITPNPDLENYKTYETQTIKIMVRAVGSPNIQKSDLKIYRNGQQIYADKSGDISLQGSTFSAMVQLEVGDNHLQVGVNGIKSSTFVAKYSASKPDLYLVSIAPNYQQTDATSSLKYTDDDARDVQQLFKSQGDKGVFRNVEMISLIGTDAEASDINKTIERLKSKYKFKEIKPQDIVLIYISAHGYVNINENGTFYIKGDDYDPLAKSYTSVSAKAIMEQLANIRCKKLLFLDACYSGGFRDDDERRAVIETIEALTQKQDGIATFTSSSGTQKSYEHTNWQNGAFTEALIEALNGRADNNADRKITIGELDTYLQNRVPRLVRSQYNEIQTPRLYINGLSRELPIFVY